MATTVLSAIDETWFGLALPPDSRYRLADLGRLYEAPAGLVLLHEGEDTRELGLVVSGRVGLRAHVPGRGPMTLLTVEQGDVFGWSAIVAPFLATSTASTVERSLIVGLEATALRAALHADAGLAASVYRQVLEAVARRLVVTRHQLYDLYRLDSYEPW